MTTKKSLTIGGVLLCVGVVLAIIVGIMSYRYGVALMTSIGNGSLTFIVCWLSTSVLVHKLDTERAFEVDDEDSYR